MREKVLSLNALTSLIEKERKGKTFVFTNGCFDLLHVGHVRYLKEAKALGDILVVGLNSDESVRQLKGSNRPIQSENDRSEILAALESVDYITLFSHNTPLHLIHALKPDILVKGGDWDLKKIVGSDFVFSYGGRVQSLNWIRESSSTKLIEKILSSKSF